MNCSYLIETMFFIKTTIISEGTMASFYDDHSSVKR